MAIITDYNNEYSDTCRGYYEYNIKQMNADLETDLENYLKTLETKLSAKKKTEARTAFIKNWIKKNYCCYRGEFIVDRDELNENSNSFEIHEGAEYEIDPVPDSAGIYNCDLFFEAIERDYGKSYNLDEIETVMFDKIDITSEDIEKIGYGEEACGVQVNGETQYKEILFNRNVMDGGR